MPLAAQNDVHSSSFCSPSVIFRKTENGSTLLPLYVMTTSSPGSAVMDQPACASVTASADPKICSMAL